MSLSFLNSGVAVVTGAASGIGRALAQRLASAGSGLAIADIDEAGLQETARSLAKSNALVTTHIVDVAKEESMKSFAAEVNARHGRLTLLINNAGVALHGNFEEVSLDDLRWLMDINFWGTVYGVKYFLPLLQREPRAHVVNLSSVFGLIAPAGQAAYSASKFAVRGFTEALRHELAPTNVCVSCVHPGGIRTPIAQRARLGAATPEERREQSIARFEKLARTPPETAAEVILRGVERREPRILIGIDATYIDVLQRVRPATYWKSLARRLKDPAVARRPSTVKQPTS